MFVFVRIIECEVMNYIVLDFVAIRRNGTKDPFG